MKSQRTSSTKKVPGAPLHSTPDLSYGDPLRVLEKGRFFSRAHLLVALPTGNYKLWCPSVLGGCLWLGKQRPIQNTKKGDGVL